MTERIRRKPLFTITVVPQGAPAWRPGPRLPTAGARNAPAVHNAAPVEHNAAPAETTGGTPLAARHRFIGQEALGSFKPPLDAPKRLSHPTVPKQNSTGWVKEFNAPDDYEVLTTHARGNAHLGEGMAGVVNLARHRHTAAYVAIKEIYPEFAESGRHEFYMASRVHSPHVVRPFFYTRARNGKALVLSPLVEGTTLRQYQGDARTLRGALLDVFRGLEAIHRAGLAHRDLHNPGNTMIDRQGAGKVIDLGNARPFTEAEGLRDQRDVLQAYRSKLPRFGDHALAAHDLADLLANRDCPLPVEELQKHTLFADLHRE